MTTTPATPDLADLAELAGRLETVEAALADVIDAVTARPAGGPWLWAGLDRDGQVELWEELAAFVAWLTGRYTATLPAREHRIALCWYRHPVAVELLTALMVAHQGAYRQSTAEPSSALVDWHERSLWPTLDRLRQLKIFTGCEQGHQDPQWTTPAWQVDDRFHEFVAQALPDEDPDGEER